jgi:hypothetical protein
VVRIGLALMAVAAVLSLGPTLLVGGRDTGVPLPWAFFENLPLLPSLIPARLAQLTALFAGLLLAVFLQAVWREGGWRRAAAVAVAVLVLIPLWPSATIPSEKVRFDAIPTSGSITFARIFAGATPPRLTGPMRRALARDLVRWRVGTVVVGPMPNQAAMLRFLTDLFESEPQQVEGVYLWRDPVPQLKLTDPGRPPS